VDPNIQINVPQAPQLAPLIMPSSINADIFAGAKNKRQARIQAEQARIQAEQARIQAEQEADEDEKKGEEESHELMDISENDDDKSIIKNDQERIPIDKKERDKYFTLRSIGGKDTKELLDELELLWRDDNIQEVVEWFIAMMSLNYSMQRILDILSYYPDYGYNIESIAKMLDIKVMKTSFNINPEVSSSTKRYAFIPPKYSKLPLPPIKELIPSQKTIITTKTQKLLLDTINKLSLNSTKENIIERVSEGLKDNYDSDIVDSIKKSFNPLLSTKGMQLQKFMETYTLPPDIKPVKGSLLLASSTPDEPEDIVDVLAMGRKRVTTKQILKHLSSKKTISSEKTKQLKIDIMQILRS